MSTDAEWIKIALAAPARRALVNAKLYSVSDLREFKLAELKQLHGIGESAIFRLKEAMETEEIEFRI